MSFHFNIWVPDSGWAEAYNQNLQPTNSPSSNQIFSMSVDSVDIQSVAAETGSHALNFLPLLLKKHSQN